jgi:hypothetical protein
MNVDLVQSDVTLLHIHDCSGGFSLRAAPAAGVWLAGRDQVAEDLGQVADDGVVTLALEDSQVGLGEMVSEPLGVTGGYVLVFRALPDGDAPGAGQGETPVAKGCQAIVSCSVAA